VVADQRFGTQCAHSREIAALIGEETQHDPRAKLRLHDLFVSKCLGGIKHRSPNVLPRQVWIGIEQILLRGALAKFSQDKLHRDARAAYDRLA
jgi:hypothetical protein